MSMAHKFLAATTIQRKGLIIINNKEAFPLVSIGYHTLRKRRSLNTFWKSKPGRKQHPQGSAVVWRLPGTVQEVARGREGKAAGREATRDTEDASGSSLPLLANGTPLVFFLYL